MNTHIVQESAAQVVELAAQKFVEAARASIAARGHFSLALAGGSTPRALYELLATPQWSAQIDWQSTHVFFGDERAVSPNDEFSNYKMAASTLLANVPLPEENIHRMQAEREDLESAARDYEAQLLEYSPLDLVLLGMGDDGHTASLFPNSPALDESTRLCVAAPVASLQPHVRRLTLTFPAINAARRVWILVTGEGKAARLQQVLEGKSDTWSTPVAGVQPQNGELAWMLDSAAASLLETQKTA